jgi:DNA-binding transcriptional MerR regulator
MTLLPVADAARLLGIHPKTLHHWLKAANLPLTVHPTDARIRCVLPEHLLEVARWHGRPLPDLASVPALEREAASSLAQAHVKPLPAHEAAPASLSDVLQQLAQLHTHVATLQQQLPGLLWNCSKSGQSTMNSVCRPSKRLRHRPWSPSRGCRRPMWEILLLPPLLLSIVCCL